ncbi:tripartite tricarboxylate transporter substrate binding protein [Bordetella sp. BOR01]|uniref:Bug family tripartite tricarboxylate transporter substrate binding protein n=1 Tax=Bordetella sp. BOR01 TaxID=2854779 RepID=UPI001C43DE08|nr:tripartite tricarboxylate transporter substrate binding protein [Bordetella sp. BOR01]MBV7486542.1 tripartite tricarboxylate transporter substrate binding protein [Bordetella sp. BOR01]
MGKKKWGAWLACLGLLLHCGPGVAQDAWPARPVRMVVAYPPGGNSDAVARLVTERLASELKASIFVENKGGASGLIANKYVSNAAPDGYTLLFGTSSAFTLQPHLRESPVVLGDFTVLGGVADYVPVMGVRNGLHISTMEQFLAYAKAHPGMSYGSSGVGTASHLAGEQLARASGVPMLHVPYKGSADALTALNAGQIDFLVDGTVAHAIQGGRITPIATFSRHRHAGLPDLPTVYEAGLNMRLPSGPLWIMAAPKGLPRAMAERISAALQAALDDPAVQAQLVRVSAAASWASPDELASQLAQDDAFYAQLTQELGISM